MIELYVMLGMFVGGLFGAGVYLHHTMGSREQQIESMCRAALGYFGSGDFATGQKVLAHAMETYDAPASTALFYRALGYYWTGDVAAAERALTEVEEWPALLEIYPSRVLALYLRAEIAALRGATEAAETRQAQAETLATRAVQKTAAPLFVTKALLRALHHDASGFGQAVKQLDRSKIGALRGRVLALIGVEFLDPGLREAGEIDRIFDEANVGEPNPLLEVALVDRPTLRAILQRHDATGVRFKART